MTREKDYSEQAARFERFGIGRLFRLVRDGVIVAGARSERIVAWNDCAGEIFGYSETEALEIPLHALVPENLREIHRTGLSRYQQTGSGSLIGSGDPVELVGLHKDGHEVPIELTLTAIPDPDPDRERFALAIVRDIADRKAAERAALQARDAAARQTQALKINDGVVQGLAVAKMALETGDADMALHTIASTLNQAKAVVANLLANIEQDQWLRTGDAPEETPETD